MRSKSSILSRLILGVLLLLIVFVDKSSQPRSNVMGTQTPGYFEVIEVADGDTIVIDMNGQEERIRLIGVDTPETQDPRKPIQCFGKAATNYVTSLIADNPVRLDSDELSSNRDRYSRLLRYVYLPDGKLLQEEIIKNGYGFAYTNFPFTKSEHFKQLETYARENNLGLWSDCSPSLSEYGTFISNPE